MTHVDRQGEMESNLLSDYRLLSGELSKRLEVEAALYDTTFGDRVRPRLPTARDQKAAGGENPRKRRKRKRT